MHKKQSSENTNQTASLPRLSQNQKEIIQNLPDLPEQGLHKKNWSNKFKVLQSGKEFQLKKNNAIENIKDQVSLFKSMSPSLNQKREFKEQVMQWGRDPDFQKEQRFRYQNDPQGQQQYRQQKVEEEKQENQLIKNMENSFEIEIHDNHHKNLIGEEAVEQFYQYYKKIDKIQQQNKFYDINNSAQTNIIGETNIQKVLPCKIGLVKEKGSEHDLNIGKMHYGDQYAEIISQGIKKIPNIYNFYLQGNRLSNKGADDLLQIISRKAKILDLSENNIGQIGCEHIAQALNSRDCKLKILNLEYNKLGDKSTIIVLEGLLKSQTIKKLNLSKNFLTDKSAEKISLVLEQVYSLEELYLHWNQIKGLGGKQIFNSLVENENLRVLDISNNSIGLGNENCVQEIENFLSKNVNLRHLDLSSNYFDLASSQKISVALEKNKTIYGFHFTGNYGYVDSRGFLVINEDQNTDLTGMNVKQRINGCNVLHKNTLRNTRDVDIKDNCWICDGWNQHTIVWEQEKSGEGGCDPLFVHFNFENYKCNYFGKQSGPTFTYERMFPPFSLFYFFTCEDTQNYDHQDDDKIIINPEGEFIKDVQLYNDQFENVQLRNINKIEIQKSDKIFDQYYNPLITVLPRTRDPKYVPAAKKKKRIKWTFPISLMYKWIPDNEEILKKCFEYDWENCKIPGKVKNQEDQNTLKEFLREKYKLIKDAYKHFASFNPIQDIWCIQNAPWLELVSQIKIIDQKVKDADINLKWTATISGGEKGNIRNPERGISRHQLMEVLVRIAEEKYILKYQKVNTFTEAMKLFWEEHLENNFDQRYNQQTWRNERYWNEQCDYCLKHYKKIVEHVYKKFSKQKVKPGQVPFMCLDELMKIIQLSGLTEDEHFGSTVGYFAFNMSMMTQIDELQSDRIFQMSQVEFYEALARIAEDASLPVGPGIVEEGFEWTWEKRKEQILGHKLEGLIIKLFNTVCDASFKANHPKIDKSFFVKNDDSDEYE